MKFALEIDLSKLEGDKRKVAPTPEVVAEHLADMIRRGELDGVVWPGSGNVGYRVARVTPSVKSKR